MTRRPGLDAAIDYPSSRTGAGGTTTAIASRAGDSRGAHMHHPLEERFGRWLRAAIRLGRRGLVPVERSIGRRIVEVARLALGESISARPNFGSTLLVALNATRGIAAVQSYEPLGVKRGRHWLRTHAIALFEDRAA